MIKGGSALFSLLIFFSLMFFMIHGALAGSLQSASKLITGQQWLQMSSDERLDCISTFMYTMAENEITLAKFQDDYYTELSEKLISNPSLYSSSLLDILIDIVYQTEPEAREGLDKFKKNKSR